MFRSSKLFVICLSLLLNFTSQATFAATTKEPVWPSLKTAYFGDKTIRDNADDLLLLETPKRAEDAAIVPVRFKSLIPQTADKYIKSITIIIDDNPMPYSAKFIFSNMLKNIDISTRMRVEQYTYVRAIAEMNDGSLHMVSRFIKASGGCSAPAGKDAEAALARLGKMQIRMRKPVIGKPTQAQVIVSHPNYSGLQFDQKIRKYIPAHYVKTVNISYNDQTMFQVEAGISLSEDPSFRFTFTPDKAGMLKAVIVDSEKKQFQMEKQI